MEPIDIDALLTTIPDDHHDLGGDQWGGASLVPPDRYDGDGIRTERTPPAVER